MKQYALDLWQRSETAVSTARAALEHGDSDAAASRAYYAAFYAVSALLSLEGETYSKHSALEAALHRDLVKTGRLPRAVGSAYNSLRTLRNTADYGGLEHVTRNQAEEAIRAAQAIIQAVWTATPGLREADS